MCFLLGMFLVLIEFTQNIRQEIESMKENWKTDQNQVELMEKLREIIWFDVNARELSSNSFFC